MKGQGDLFQPIVIGTWCRLCLIAAFAMAMMTPYSLNKFVAMREFMVCTRCKGKTFWRTFWCRDGMGGGCADKSKGLVRTTREKLVEVTRGVKYPWTLLLIIVIAVWLTFTRLTFDSSGARYVSSISLLMTG